MTAPEVVLALLWVGITAYALLAGADFGGGVWDLLAGGPEKGRDVRRLVEQSLGPVWEANHVWLIFALVVLWTGFPTTFAAVASTLYIPLTAVAIGVILRGSTFAFRKAVTNLEVERAFGATFALSSVITPFFLGTIAGAVASGRVPVGNAAGDPITSWFNPTSVLGGALAVVTCSYLAAVFLAADSRRQNLDDLARYFQRRAIVTGLLAGLTAIPGIAILASDSPDLFDGLTGRALPLIIGSAIMGILAIVLLLREQFTFARLASALAVTAIIWGWAAGQYPYLLENQLTIEEGASSPEMMRALLTVLIIGTVFLAPGLIWLFRLISTGRLTEESTLASSLDD